MSGLQETSATQVRNSGAISGRRERHKQPSWPLPPAQRPWTAHRANAQRIRAEETDSTRAADQRSRAQPPTPTAPAPRATASGPPPPLHFFSWYFGCEQDSTNGHRPPTVTDIAPRYCDRYSRRRFDPSCPLTTYERTLYAGTARACTLLCACRAGPGNRVFCMIGDLIRANHREIWSPPMAKCVSVYYEVCCVGVKIAELEIRKETSCLQRNDYSLRVLLSQDRPWLRRSHTLLLKN